MPLDYDKYDESRPCIKCGGQRRRSPKGYIYCIPCNKNYRIKNLERVLDRDRNYYKRNKERYKIVNKKYREENGESIKKYERSKERRNQIKEWKQKGSTGCRHPDYPVWVAMKRRCLNPNDPKYPSYGGRGIIVCDRWKHSFQNFIEDMGERPEPRYNYSIDRYPDVNGNYEPNNCRWATPKQQGNNTRKNIEYKLSIPDDSLIYYPYGNLITLKEFSKQTGLPLIICKYRYALHPLNTEWILDEKWDNRFYTYKGHKYNLTELCLISGKNYATMTWRIRHGKWDVEKAVET